MDGRFADTGQSGSPPISSRSIQFFSTTMRFVWLVQTARSSSNGGEIDRLTAVEMKRIQRQAPRRATLKAYAD